MNLVGVWCELLVIISYIVELFTMMMIKVAPISQNLWSSHRVYFRVFSLDRFGREKFQAHTNSIPFKINNLIGMYEKCSRESQWQNVVDRNHMDTNRRKI